MRVFTCAAFFLLYNNINMVNLIAHCTSALYYNTWSAFVYRYKYLYGSICSIILLLHSRLHYCCIVMCLCCTQYSVHYNTYLVGTRYCILLTPDMYKKIKYNIIIIHIHKYIYDTLGRSVNNGHRRGRVVSNVRR